MVDDNSELEKWKHKYLEMLEKLEQKERAWHQTDESLRRGLSRLALLSTGLNPGLDVQLNRLRRALQDQGNSEYLDGIVAKISDYLKTMDEQGGGETTGAQAGNTFELLVRMMESIDFPKPYQSQAKRLQRLLKENKTEARLEQWLNDFSKLVATAFYQPGEGAAETGAAGKKSGWWNKLFSGGAEKMTAAVESVPHVQEEVGATRDDWGDERRREKVVASGRDGAAQASGAKQLEKVLLDFLEHLAFPAEFSQRVQAVRDQLVAGLSADAVKAVTRSLVDLVTDTQQQLEREKEELELFLRQLGVRLQELDSMVEGAESNRLASLHSGRELDEIVKAQVNDIEQTVQNVDDVDRMKGLIQGSLENIRQHLAEKRLQEEHRQEDLQQQLKTLNQRLSQMEGEGERLRARLAEEREQAITDPLTNVPNRLGYEKRVAEEFARWQRYGNPLSLLVCDIDHFKRINDSFGHKAGDRALVAIAKSIDHHIRATDYLARIGGEEFVVLLPETTLADARIVAEKLRKGVELCAFVYEGKPVPITISGGIAEFAKGDKVDDVYVRADKALYRAKKQGRNRFLSED